MALFGLGLGMIVSALTTKYRDLRFLVSFSVELLMYVDRDDPTKDQYMDFFIHCQTEFKDFLRINMYNNRNVLNKNNLGNIYRTLIAIHASYNLIDKIDHNKLTNLLSYVDKSLDSFVGYHFEILYLLSLTQGNIEESMSLYLQIIENEKIPSSIKERVDKINEFEKYK